MTSNNTEQSSENSEQQAIIGTILQEILASLPPSVTDMVQLAAIPHWFNQELLSHLVGDEVDLEQAFKYIQRLSFVRPKAQGRFMYHDAIRHYLLAWWRENPSNAYKAANQAALDYFKAKVSAVIEQPIDERAAYEREVLYHQLIVDESTGLWYLSERFEDACWRYQLGMAEGLVAQAVQLQDELTPKGHLWIHYFEARLDQLYHRDDFGEAIFQDLADQTSVPVLQALACWKLGELRVSQRSWSKAIKLYQTSLDSLQKGQTLNYRARVMVSLGNAYYDLADNSGGFRREDDKPNSKVGRFLYNLQNLPFLLYEWLARRVHFLPPYFGTNYQNWIIVYLLNEAMQWYRQAEKQFRVIENLQGLTTVQLSMAELQHQIGRWSLVRRRYETLLKTNEIKGSLYRTARVLLGEGRAFLDEGDLIQAEAVLLDAIKTFRRFQDNRSIGITADLLGRIYTDLDQLSEAMFAYLESIRAFESIGDHLARTQVVWLLEDLGQHTALTNELKQQISLIVSQVIERHYVTRFPNRLLFWFRRWALLGVIPLTYILTFGISLALAVSTMIIETDFELWRAGANVQTSLRDALILTAGATLPIPLFLWLYRFIYSFVGIIFVSHQGRRLLPIEQEQPSQIVTNSEGLRRQDVNKNLSRTVSWLDVSMFASVDYYQLYRPFQLISASILTANHGKMVTVDGVTAGYDYLKQDIMRHLGYRQDDVEQKNLNFVVFEPKWVLTVVVICLIFALSLVNSEIFKVTGGEKGSNEVVVLRLTSIMFSFVPTLLLVFPVTVLWRLVRHQIAFRNLFEYQAKIIPFWVLWLGVIVGTVIVSLWVFILLLLGST